MKNLYLLIAVMLSWLGGNAQCVTNGDFENGYTGHTYRKNPSDITFFDVVDCHIDVSDPLAFPIITTNPATNSTTAEGAVLVSNSPSTPTGIFDSALFNVGIFVPRVNPTGGGTQAMKLNRSTGGTDITIMSTPITPTSASIGFSYSAIIQAPHPGDLNQQPFFTARILDGNGNIVSINEICLKADEENPLFLHYEGNVNNNFDDILYTNWQCAVLNIPDELIDENLILEIIATDCGYTDHFGTVYIDNITCTPACENYTGTVSLQPVNEHCPGEQFVVCVDYTVPAEGMVNEGSLDDQHVLLEIWQDGVLVTTLSTPSTFSGTQFCFTVSPSDFGIDPEGDYEFRAVAQFTMPDDFIWEVFDSSANLGPDVSFLPVDVLADSYIEGDMIHWPNVSETYVLEFISDGECCPTGVTESNGRYFTITVTDNSYDLDLAISGTQSKCFRWRIMTDCGWSCWCCIADVSNNQSEFPGEDYANVHAPSCYEGPVCEETLTIPNANNTINANVTRLEHLDVSIIAYNIVLNDGTGIYKAGEFIELRPDFSAQTGSVFSATIEPCDAVACEMSEPLPRMNMATGSEHNEMESETLSTNSFTVYPNPTNGLITVTGDAASIFTITDITGKQLMRIANEGQSTSVDIDLSGLNAGIYFLSADGKTIQKIIKN